MKNCRCSDGICWIVLALPMVACQLDFTNMIYDKYGFDDGVTQQLSSKNLTELVNKVLDGRYYKYNTDHLEAGDKYATPETICHTSYHMSNTSSLPITAFDSYCPEILYSLTQDCVKSEERSHHQTKVNIAAKPLTSSVWGYGLLFVTLINLLSLVGVFVLPLMNKSFYSTLLMFLISLAVGTLVASGVLNLIPGAFEIKKQEGYRWKACVVMGGVYLFFLTERVLKMIIDNCSRRKNNEEHYHCKAAETDVVPTIDIDRDVKLLQTDDEMGAAGEMNHNGGALNGEVKTLSSSSADSFTTNEKKPVATVAWMIIFGDAFHNFIDGLSIGAAFSDSILLGISVCLAVVCEELPHELGDFAVLLNAGLSKKRALLLNFLSACTCYLGLAIGISLSQVSHAKPWIMGIAGGMFLYIALADMMPEMNHAAEEHKDKPIRVLLIQNAGLLIGFTAILLISTFESQIRLV